MLFPSDLLDCLRTLVPGFANEAPRDQESLARMLWMTTELRRQHTEHEGMVSFSKQCIRRVWGSDSRMRATLCGRYFTVLSGSNLGTGYTNGYTPTQEMVGALQHCMSNPINLDMTALDGRTVRTFPRAIASLAGGRQGEDRTMRSGGRKTKWRGVTPANSIAIDINSLLALRQRLVAEAASIATNLASDESDQSGLAQALAKLRSRQLAIDALIKMSRNTVCPGSVPIRYVEQSTGRLFAEGLSLQSVPREVRSAALAGCWDYDISNCHWSLINQLAERSGLVCTAIRDYLANRAAVRNEIALGAAISADDAKGCLLMLMYGAPATMYEDASIPKLIGEEAASKFYRLSAVKRLHADVMKARRVIVDNLPVQRGGWVVNAMGLQISRKAKPKFILAHILQGLEAMALRAVVQMHGDNVLVCLHDGWVTRTQLQIDELEALIGGAIGLKVAVEEKRMPPVRPLDLAASLDPADKTVLRLSTEGNKTESAPSCATSSPVLPLLPPNLAVTDQCWNPGGLVLSRRPTWNRPRKPTPQADLTTLVA